MQDKINNDMLKKIDLNDVEFKNVKVSQINEKIEYETFLEFTNYKEKDILNENYFNAIMRDDKYPNTYTDYCENKVEPLNDSKEYRR